MSESLRAWTAFSEYWVQLMLPWSVHALVLVGAAAIAARLDRARPAAARHFFWLGVMVALGLLPLWALAARSIPAPQSLTGPLGYVPRISTVPSDAHSEYSALPDRPRASAKAVVSQALCAAWAIGVLVIGARMILSRQAWRRLRANARVLENPSITHTPMPLPLGYSTEIAAPVLTGLLHPMILLPEYLEHGVADEEREAIVLHELAHFRRRDHVITHIQAVLGAVFFFHPAVRYALNRLSIERELACDEDALRTGARPSVYAEALLKVVERAARSAPLNLSFHASRKLLERRMDMILKTSLQPNSPKPWRFFAVSRVAGILAFAMLLLPQQRAAHGSSAPPPRVPVEAAHPTGVATPPQDRPPQNAVPPMGRVSGRVLDTTGAVIPGVSITLTGPEVSLKALTNDSGSFVFPVVLPGPTNLEAQLNGFENSLRQIVVQPGVNGAESITLRVGRLNAAINVRTSRNGPAAAASPISPPVRVGGDYVAPKLLSAPRPPYPAGARDARIEDIVVLEATIGANGSVAAIQRVRGGEELARAAMDAVLQWRYTPGLLNGTPVEVQTVISITFSLTD